MITPTPGGVRFDVALAGRNRVEVHGALAVAVGRRLELRLRGLDEVEFTGELRTKATVGGAAVGAVVTGPLAPLGAVAGYLLTDRYIDGRARAARRGRGLPADRSLHRRPRPRRSARSRATC